MENFFENLLAAVGGNALTNVISALLILVIGLIVIKKLTKSVEKSLEKRSRLEHNIVRLLMTVVRFALYFLLLISCAQRLGIPTASLVTLLGTFGLAFSLALQSSLGDLAGGIFILVTKPFKVGDYVQAAGAEGTVYEIGFIHTKIMTVDNRAIYVPNSAITGSNVVNFSTARRQVDLDIPVSYQCDLEKAKAVITDAVAADSRVVEAPFVRVWDLASSAVNIKVRAWVKGADYWEARSAMVQNIKQALDKNDISIPFTQIDIHMDQVK